MSSSEVWATLSPINCKEHTEQKGKFTYLSWTWAWAMVKQHYPTATFTIEPENVLPNGSMEVRTTVTVEGLTLPMWLAVTDFNNNSIMDPKSSDIANSRMRCLTKNIAMFGLGHYIYAGESLPQEPTASNAQWEELVALVGEKDSMGVRIFSDRVGPDIMTALFNMADSGKKTQFKDQVREMYRQSKELVKSMAEGLTNSVDSQSPSDAQEIISEIAEPEWRYVLGFMAETDVSRFKQFVKEHDLEGVPHGI